MSTISYLPPPRDIDFKNFPQELLQPPPSPPPSPPPQVLEFNPLNLQPYHDHQREPAAVFYEKLTGQEKPPKNKQDPIDEWLDTVVKTVEEFSDDQDDEKHRLFQNLKENVGCDNALALYKECYKLAEYYDNNDAKQFFRQQFINSDNKTSDNKTLKNPKFIKANVSQEWLSQLEKMASVQARRRRVRHMVIGSLVLGVTGVVALYACEFFNLNISQIKQYLFGPSKPMTPEEIQRLVVINRFRKIYDPKILFPTTNDFPGKIEAIKQISLIGLDNVETAITGGAIPTYTEDYYKKLQKKCKEVMRCLQPYGIPGVKEETDTDLVTFGSKPGICGEISLNILKTIKKVFSENQNQCSAIINSIKNANLRPPSLTINDQPISYVQYTKLMESYEICKTQCDRISSWDSIWKEVWNYLADKQVNCDSCGQISNTVENINNELKQYNIERLKLLGVTNEDLEALKNYVPEQKNAINDLKDHIASKCALILQCLATDKKLSDYVRENLCDSNYFS
jgi:hypothetical protein